MEPLQEAQLEKLSRLTFQVIKLVFYFKDKEMEQPEHIRVFVDDTIVAVADGAGLKKSTRALSLVPLDIKPKLDMDIKKLEMIYSDAVSFATYYPEEGHGHKSIN